MRVSAEVGDSLPMHETCYVYYRSVMNFLWYMLQFVSLVLHKDDEMADYQHSWHHSS